MLELLKDSRYDFMTRANLLLGISLALLLASVAVLLVKGLNYGIEFTGGTELQVKYATKPDVGSIRSTLQQAGMTNQSVTTIGDPSENEVYIRLGSTSELGSENMTSKAVQALRAGIAQAGRVDLNVADQKTIETLLRAAPTLSSQQAADAAARISERRKELAIFRSMDDLAQVEGITPDVLTYLQDKAFIGPLAVRSQSYIGPVIGRELLNKALLAVAGSLAGMLVYIWLRFQFQWGLANVVALVHDTVITLGLFSLFGKEMSLPVVASFLTLIGYSSNDTVVTFDRIRENLRNRVAPTFGETINLSINQTLPRTIITSGLTWIVVFGLYLFGGEALNSFSFVLTAGVIVGTYSSIYIASPCLLLWQRFVKRGADTQAGVPAGERRARKVRSSSSSGRV